MTSDEVYQILKDLEKLLCTMDREHTEKLFQTFIGDLHGKTKTILPLPELRKTIKNLIHCCMKMPHPVNWFSYKQMKRIYEIVGDYDYYPVCGLCGEKIKINSETAKNTKTSNHWSFSWDHILPKSLGGETSLKNLQPAHKICNNHKGNGQTTCKTPENYRAHYDVNININMNIGCQECIKCAQRQKRKKTRYNLRKQDSWCHKPKKHFYQRHR